MDIFLFGLSPAWLPRFVVFPLIDTWICSLFPPYKDIPRRLQHRRHVGEGPKAKLFVYRDELLSQKRPALGSEIHVVRGEDIRPKCLHAPSLAVVHGEITDTHVPAFLQEPLGIAKGGFPVWDHGERVGEGDEVHGAGGGESRGLGVAGVSDNDLQTSVQAQACVRKKKTN